MENNKNLTESTDLIAADRPEKGEDVVTQDSMGELMCLKEEKDRCMQNNQSLVHEVEELGRKNKELEDLLNREEQKKACFYLNLSSAVLKGKYFVQERDGMKQKIVKLNAEIEKLQCQLQEKDGEISFLRQEFTRCNNDATQISNKRSTDEMQDLLTWSSIPRASAHDLASDNSNGLLDNKYKEVLEKKILDLNSGLENLRVVAHNKDVMLQEERNKVEELTQKEQLLQNSVRVMKSQLLMRQGAEDSAKATACTSDVVEVDQQGEDVVTLRKKLEDSIGELMCLKEEKDRCMQNNQSLANEVEVLGRKNKELEDLFNREERKSASIYSKLSSVVLKASYVVQERDGMKQKIEELNAEIEKLQSQKQEKDGEISFIRQEVITRCTNDALAVTQMSKKRSTGEMQDSASDDSNRLLDNKYKEVLEKKILDLNTELENLRVVAQNKDVMLQEERNKAEELTQKEQLLPNSVRVLKSQLLMRQGAEDSAKATACTSEIVEVDQQGEDVVALRKKLEDSMGELMCLKLEKDRCMHNNQSLVHEVEELGRKNKELGDLLNLEEQRGASLFLRLTTAVWKGKHVVRQRDGLRQKIEELNAEIERLKVKTELNEKVISESEEQVNKLLAVHERIQVVESENNLLRDRLAETERSLQQKEDRWNSILDAVSEINACLEINSGNPVEDIKKIGKYLHDQHSTLDSLEQESRKSKRAVELLLAKLNEVQERNDSHQDVLANAPHELSAVSREKELPEHAKCEALAHVENVAYLQAEERDRRLSEMAVSKSNVENMRDDLSAIERELGDVLSKDLEVLYNMKAMVESFLEICSTPVFKPPFCGGFSCASPSTKSDNKDFMTQIGSLRELLQNHSCLLQEKSSRLSEVVININREFTSRKELCGTLKMNVQKFQLDDLQQARAQLHDSQTKLDVMKEGHHVLEISSIKELEDQETNSKNLQQKVNSLSDALASKVQESESLTQALDEKEVELQQKKNDMENHESSRAKALKELSLTVSKSDEHSLSENLLSEVEKLQFQLKEKDGEISFLRQEVTRCTNDALAVTQMSKKRSTDEMQDLQSWFYSSISRVPVHDLASDDSKRLLDNKYKEVLEKKFLDLNSELENLRVVAQNKDVMLQEERNKAEELAQKEQLLQNSVRVMESQLLMHQGDEDSAKATACTSEIVEVDQQVL